VIHVVTRLPRDLELRFKAELASLPASEGFMTTTKLITPWEKIAMEEGLARGRVEGQVEGLAKGRVEGRVEGVTEGRKQGLIEGLLNALETRFGAVPESVSAQLKEVRDESRLRQAIRLALTEPSLERFLTKL
jgi:phenylpyruvate tautomerase PptA (4-oxalocrotonate tautomerase family)